MKEQTPTPNLSRNIRDQIFCDLFRDSINVMQLYHDFHPEDATAKVTDLEILTLEHVLTDGPYNDLGFLVHGKLMVLVEAQSTWSLNILSRMLLYLAETYRRYLRDRNITLYDGGVVHLPTPELYVVYTGNKDVPDEISFTRDILGGAKSSVEITAHVVRKEGGTIVGQYISFCKAYDEFIKQHGRNFTPEQARDFILGCIKRGILPLFLQMHLSEVVDTMFTVFDKEEEEALYWRKQERLIYEKAWAEGITEGKAEGRAEGRAEGKAEGKAEGRAEGRAEGLAEGEAKGKAEAILQMSAITDTPAEELLDKMALPAEERAAVIAVLQELQSA